METRLRSLDLELARNPVCGMCNSEDVRDLLTYVWPRICGQGGKSMHSFFDANARTHISMKELLNRLPILQSFQDAHEEQHTIDAEYGDVACCVHCVTIVWLRTKNPRLLRR